MTTSENENPRAEAEAGAGAEVPAAAENAEAGAEVPAEAENAEAGADAPAEAANPDAAAEAEAAGPAIPSEETQAAPGASDDATPAVYLYSFARSQELFERATKVIPCGIYGHYSPAPLVPPTSYPFFAVEALGSHFLDVDGNDFIDYMCEYGPMVLGYRNEVVEEAVRAQQEKAGDIVGAPSPLMVDLAELLVDTVTGADWAMFAKNGGDVTNFATMVARAATGRRKIVAIEGGYHGVAAWMQGGGHHGVTDGDVRDFVRIPWNDLIAFERVLAENPDQIAGFIATPYHHPTFGDSALPHDGYWVRVQQLCRRHGIVLIIDDVRCGFRLSVAGSHHYFGFEPDLVCFCKAIGNGYPISALVGREALKDEAAKVFFTGSYWYQAVPMAAAIACIQEMRRIDAARIMQEYGKRLTDSLIAAAAAHGYHLKATGVPSMPYMRITDDESLMTHQRFCSECTRRGAYMTSHHNWFMSAAHTEEDLERTVAIADDVFAELEREVGPGGKWLPEGARPVAATAAHKEVG